jgi:hypothetical protein
MLAQHLFEGGHESFGERRVSFGEVNRNIALVDIPLK